MAPYLLILLGFAVVAAALVWFRLFPLRPGLPTPAKAAPKADLDCSLPEFDFQTLEEVREVELTPAIQGGLIVGTTITLPKEKDLSLSQSLTLVAQDDITINAEIRARDSVRQIDITMISLNGRVQINEDAQLISSTGIKGTDDIEKRERFALARAGAASSGGDIRLQGIELDIRGNISPGQGPGGGDAESAIQGRRQGTAVAVGGGGGHGGHVRLCASSVIKVSSGISGGIAGDGGNAKAMSRKRAFAVAIGGPGGKPGDVTFEGIDAQRPCRVEAGFISLPPSAGAGGEARAQGGTGGPAFALGGDGGEGEELRFINCTIVSIATNSVLVRNGGDGGKAFAVGGDAPVRPLPFARILSGGNATARGGDGGPKSDFAGVNLHGKGGDATIQTGNGSSPFGRSGGGTTQGGSSGAGTPGQRFTLRRNRPVGGVGGQGEARTAKGSGQQ